MDNRRDTKELQEQFKLLKKHNEKTSEYLSAIELLIVDDNNGRVKDSTLKGEMVNLTNRVNELNRDIDMISNKLN